VDTLRIKLLGVPRVEVRGQVVAEGAWQRADAKKLLCALALKPGNGVGREQLCQSLWPALQREEARKKLTNSLYCLRKALPLQGERIQADAQHVQLVWGEDDWLDVERFEAALDSASCASQPQEKLSLLEEALNLYEGPLLPQWHDQAWLGSDRELLASRWRWALGQAVEVSSALGQLESAVRWQRALVSSAPAQPSQQARLIELLLQAGDVPAAAQQYKRCREVLASELGQQPDAALQALEARIKALQPGSPAATQPPPAAQPANGVPPSAAAQNHPVTATAAAAAAAAAAATNASPLVPAIELVGRTQDTEALLELLLVGAADSRIIVMTGLGGVGKTSLARSVMAKWAAHTGQPARFVQVSEITAAELLADVLRQALGLPTSLLDESASSADPSRHGHINGLLVIDNFEHLEQHASLVNTLVQRCPQLTVLITSRIALPLAQAAHYPLAPLDAGTAGVALFVKHARKRNASLSFNYQEIDEIARICTLLDGLPLAIELAAARVRLYSPAQLLQRLLRDLQLLHDNPIVKAGEARCVRGGARSLWEVLQWSYQQLQPDQQELLTWLSVFPGGATLEMLEQVLQAQPWSVPDVLEGLLDLQLVSVKHAAPGLAEAAAAPPPPPRYGLLETVRHFVLHSGLPSKAWLAQARQGQAHYFVQCMEQIGEQDFDAATVRARKWCQMEMENLVATIKYYCISDPTVGASMVCRVLCCFWNNGHVHQAKQWLNQIGVDSAVKLSKQDKDRVRLFEMYFTANYGRVIDAEALVEREIACLDGELDLSISKTALINFCVQFLWRVRGRNDEAFALCRRLWVASRQNSVNPLLKHEAALQWAAILVVVGEIDLLEKHVSECRDTIQKSKDTIQLGVYSATGLAMRGHFRKAIDKIESVNTEVGEKSGTFWGTCKCTAGLLAVDSGQVALAASYLAEIQSSVKGRSFPANLEVLCKQLEVFVGVFSDNTRADAISTAISHLSVFGQTSARNEWVSVCIEAAVLARDLEATRRAVNNYCERPCPLTFMRSLRVTEALGGYAALLGEKNTADEFYALANAARRITNGKILPIHADLRKSVGASVKSGESCGIFENIVLADLSGKRFWELVAQRARSLLVIC
jgi:predicted ATPase/DNA-binding SARP family transcriptional activator